MTATSAANIFADDRSERWVGAAMTAIALVHNGAHVAAGRWYDVLWICNVAALMLGPGILLRSRAIAAVAITWLPPGTIVWSFDALVSGAHILPSSWFLHLGGTAASIFAVRRAGSSDRGWVVALSVLACALLLSFLVAPPTTNVNAVRRVPSGWHFLGGSRAAFVVCATSLVIVLLAIGHRIGRWLAPSAPDSLPRRL